MYHLLLIVKNNLRKKKGDVAVLAFLIMMAALLLYISISVLTRTPQVIETVYEEVNAADFFFCSSSKETEKIASTLKAQPGVKQLELSEGIRLKSGKYHVEKKEKDRENAGEVSKETSFLLEPMEFERTICKIPDIKEDKPYNSILLPYYLKNGEGVRIGDKFYLTIGKEEYEFVVDGFVEDPLFATPLNISVYRCYITEKFYTGLLDSRPELDNVRCYLYKIKLDEETPSRNFDEDIMALLTKEVPDLANYMNLGINGDTMKWGAGFMSEIGMGILLVFSVLIIGIAIIIIYFSVYNFTESNMKNIGILMASGYTKKQLIGTSCMEMLSVSLVSSCIGLIAGVFLNEAVGNLEAALIGLKWNLSFDFTTAVLVFVLVNLIVLGVTYFVSRVYGKIEILDALRGGIRTHNFKKNHLPLHENRLPEPLALGLKSILGEKGKNLAIMGIVIVLSFASCIGFALYQNFGLDSETLMKLLGLEMGTACVGGNGLEEIGKQLESWQDIDKVLFNDNRSVRLTCGAQKVTVTCDFWLDPDENENAVVVEGRLPRYDNEIGITAPVAKQLGVGVGDVIYVEGEKEKKDYIVSCIDQKMLELGRRAMMTMDGAARINGEKQVSYLYLYTKEGYVYEQLEKDLTAKFDAITITDNQKSIETMLSSVKMAMKMICAVFTILTIVIVSLIITLLVRTKVTKEWKQFGIYKALGFTTKQLVLQTQLSNLPVVFIGAVLGAVLSIYLLNPLVALFLSLFGIVKCEFGISSVWLILTVVVIVATAVIVSFVCAYRVRRIEPVSMLTEE